jgi:hypothetical protein
MLIKICIKENISKDRQKYFGNLTINHINNNTELSGEITDNSTLYGILNQIRDLNLSIISLNVTYKND